MKLRYRLVLLGLIGAIVMYLPVPQYQFNLISLYHNPLYRFGEFSVGVILSSMLVELKQMKWQKWLFNIVTFVISFALLVTLVFVFYHNGIQIEKRMYYEVFILPLFGLMILVLGGIACKPIDNSKIVRYIASLCYALYLVQIPREWFRFIVNSTGINNNILLILFIIFMYTCFAIVLHEMIERPMGLLKKKVNNI